MLLSPHADSGLTYPTAMATLYLCCSYFQYLSMYFRTFVLACSLHALPCSTASFRSFHPRGCDNACSCTSSFGDQWLYKCGGTVQWAASARNFGHDVNNIMQTLCNISTIFIHFQSMPRSCIFDKPWLKEMLHNAAECERRPFGLWFWVQILLLHANPKIS